jgi:acetyl esterase/lipase
LFLACGFALEGLGATFESATLGRGLAVEVVAPRVASGAEAYDTVIYLKGLAGPRLGDVDDVTLIGEMAGAGLLVLVVDYEGDSKAAAPGINQDLLKLRSEVEALAGNHQVNLDRVFVLPAGYRLARDIEFYRDEQKTYRADVRYPAGGASVPLIVQIPHNNDARMNMQSIVKYRDSMLEGLMVRGYAVAVVDHPVAPPYRGIDAAPETMHKMKAAVRTLRAGADQFGYNGSKIGVLGFSRGSGVAGLLAATGGEQSLEGAGPHRDQSSEVQAVLCQAGRFDHRTLMEDGFSAKTFANYVAHFGDPVKDAKRWDAASAARWITADDPPFFLEVGGADSYRVGQVRKLHEALLAIGVAGGGGAEHPYVVEPGRGHRVTEKLETLEAIGAFFDRVLKGE